MRVVCVWCGQEYGEKQGDAGEVSHGICAACQVAHFPEFAPLVVVDGLTAGERFFLFFAVAVVVVLVGVGACGLCAAGGSFVGR